MAPSKDTTKHAGTKMASQEDDKLASRIQALAQELQDHILDFVLTTNINQVTIDDDYKPPAQLAISRKTRKTFAEDYYSETTFMFKYIVPFKCLSGKWLRALPPDHVALLTDVRAGEGLTEPPLAEFIEDEEDALAEAIQWVRWKTRDLESQHYVQLPRTALKTPYWFVEGDQFSGCPEQLWANEEGPCDG